MATKKKGKPLVIVESPAKARTIAKFLGGDYVIEASVGHVRDLPANASEVPPKLKTEKWARLGIDIENEFSPLYVVPKDKRDHMSKLKKLVKEADVVYLATDEDREGESISWHLVQVLEPKGEVRRLVFHEITKAAIEHALENPRSINQDLVEAQETRRIVDRLYGYSVSPLLWKKIRPRLSAGRVQSVAVRLVVEREQERMRFVVADYWSVTGTFETPGEQTFEATLASVAGKRIAIGKDFVPDTGALDDKKDALLHLTEASAGALCKRLSGKPAQVESLEQKPYTERPQPPFTTSTLQQDAGRKLGFPAKRTMRAAQRLYENGYITYMRTDSTTLSDEAIGAARALIAKTYGKEYLPDAPRTYKTKVRNAQEAHEAIRPAGATFTPINQLGRDMGSDEQRLYELIWRRTVACQMKDATGKRTTLTLAIDDARFTTSGRTIDFKGFLLAYAQTDEDEDGGTKGRSKDKAEAEPDRILPDVAAGDRVATRELTPEGHSTKPPARLTEATLVKELEARGIGRPSTYASIIDTILQREYCFKKGNALAPTLTAFAVVNLLDRHLTYLIDYAFTAKMEDELDEISNGKLARLAYLRRFFHGNGKPGLKDSLATADEKVDPRAVCTIGGFDLGEHEGAPIEVRVGRYGPFLSCDGVSASLPDELAPDELSRDVAHDLLAKAKAGPKSLGTCPETGLPIYVKSGRYGPYFQRGDAESLGDEKPKMASLLADMDPATVTLEQALQVLALPRIVGKAKPPDSDEEIDVVAHNGRYGPYLKWGKETRSIPKEDHLLTISLARALEILAQPKQRGRTQAAAPKVLRELGEHPTTKQPLRVLDGRYGPYVTDGKTNATIPKDEDAAGIGLARAVELIEARQSRGPSRSKRSAKASSPRSASKSPKRPASGNTGGKASRAKQSGKPRSRERAPSDDGATPSGRAGSERATK